MIEVKRWFRIQDLAWVIFVVILIVTGPETNYQASILLPLIGAFQIVEPRLKIFASQRGQVVSIALKLIMSYLLVGWTHTIDSYYSSIFLIPVVSAATTFELPAVILVTLIASLAYFSFLLPVFPVDYDRLPPDQISLMSLRAAFYAIVAFLVYDQAKAKRDEMKRTQEAAASLAESRASLRRSERLAALGQLTAGLAHELRNPLGTIKASAEMLTKNLTKGRPEVLAEMTGYIGTEVTRINGLITSFLDFARPLQIHPARADFQAVLDDSVQQQSELAKNREVKVVKRIEGGPVEFAFDSDLLKIALTNLVQNAIQASARGQQVEIRAMARDQNLIVLVSDHGEGIQPQHLESIFNPFFTTKPQGVGLGLPIVSKIVDEHQGRLQVFSEPGKGTTFEMTLPQA
jgi:two-component system, NtrC family, sensor histidine kinase HydH